MSFYATPFSALGLMIVPHTITFAIDISDDEAIAFNAYDSTLDEANQLGPKMWQCGENVTMLNTGPDGCRFYITRQAIGVTDTTLDLIARLLRDHLDICVAKAEGAQP